MITDLVEIRRLGEKKRQENLRFRRHLKSHAFVERQFRRTAEEIEQLIDCRQCAECCRVTEVNLTERDIEKLARFLRVSTKQFLEGFTSLDTDGNIILRREEGSGCIFLHGKDCTVYDARPADCERFPHLVRGAGSIQSRLWRMPDRATYCPIVYNWLEAVKTLARFSR